MERLTKRDFVFSSNYVANRLQSLSIAQCLKKLQQYENAEEDGRLVVLPCKPGETVYKVSNNTDACMECNAYSDFYGMDAMCDKQDKDHRYYPRNAENPICEKQFFEIVEYKPSLDYIFRHRHELGKTIFMTREEAESSLAERTKDNNG